MPKRKVARNCPVQFKEICVKPEHLSDSETDKNPSLEYEEGKPDDSVESLNEALYFPPNECEIESTSIYTKKKKNLWISKRLYQCLSCSHKTNKRSNMTDHLKIHTPPTDIEWFPCGLCAYKAKHKRSINRHHQKVHKLDNIINLDKLETPELDMKMKSQEAHEYNSSSNEEKVEQEPSNIASGIVVYQEHCTLEILEAEGDDRRLTGKFDCNQIGYIETIIVRRNMNHQGAIYQCQSCPYSSMKKSNMRDHVVKHKPLEEIDWYTCSRCKYQTKYKRSITRHIKTVHKLEQDQCEIVLIQERTENTGSLAENECDIVLDEGFIQVKKKSRLEIDASQHGISNRRNKRSKFAIKVEYRDLSNQEFIEIKAEPQSDLEEKMEDERADVFEGDNSETDCDKPQYVDLPELQNVHIKSEDTFGYAEVNFEEKIPDVMNMHAYVTDVKSDSRNYHQREIHEQVGENNTI